MMEDQVVSILPDNPSDCKNPTEVKLIKLYNEYNLTALKLIKLQKKISNSIYEDNGIKLENYSLLEKELINRFINIKKIILSYERNNFLTSLDLDKFRTLVAAQQEIIDNQSYSNRNKLKLSLKKISAQLDTFSRKILYSAPFSRQTSPQFVDFRI